MRALAWISPVLVACGSPAKPWQIVAQHLPAAVLSVWGTSATNVFVVGADVNDGRGPLVEHFDGTGWTRLATGQQGTLWWVYGFAGGPVLMAGDGGLVLRYDAAAGTFTRVPTPAGNSTVFGIWGAAPDDLWAVGGNTGGANGAFAWRSQGGAFTPASGFPADLAGNNAMWKINGRSANDAWLVGTSGKLVGWNGSTLAEQTVGGESFFTVSSDAQRYVAVGGVANGIIVENAGAGWQDASPSGALPLVGVDLSPKGDYAVGQAGAVYVRGATKWSEASTGLLLEETLHSVWVDPSGGVWAVGGQLLTVQLTDGIVLHKGASVPGGL